MNSLTIQDIINKIIEWDRPAFYFINKTINNRALDLLFPVITRLAEPAAIIILCALLFLIGKFKAKLTSVFILLTSFTSFIIAQVLKDTINRPRPLEVYKEISVIGTVQSPSFPSTHSVLIAAIVTILCIRYKKWSFILIPIALLVGISRIYLGHHFPSDVVFGFALGSILSVLFLGFEGLIKSMQSL